MMYRLVSTSRAALVAALLARLSVAAFAQDASVNPDAAMVPDPIIAQAEVVERGQDFAVYRTISAVTDAQGALLSQQTSSRSLKTPFTTSRMGNGRRAKT